VDPTAGSVFLILIYALFMLMRSTATALQALRQLHPQLDVARTFTRGHTPATNQRASRIKAFDELLAGGLLPGSITEMVGHRSCGRFSTLLQTLAAFTRRGEVAALVDLGDGLDPQAAADARIDLSRLLWARPRHLKPALITTELLLNTGFPLVVLDLGTPPVPGGRGPESSWVRLARAAQKHGSILFVSSPYRASGSAARVIVEACKTSTRWHGAGRTPKLLGAITVRLQLAKAIGRGPAPAQHVEWTSSLSIPDGARPDGTGTP